MHRHTERRTHIEEVYTSQKFLLKIKKEQVLSVIRKNKTIYRSLIELNVLNK